MLGPAQKSEIIDLIYSELGLPAAVKKASLRLRDVMTEMEDDPDFGKAVNMALQHLSPIAEQELFRRAVKGVDSYVTSQGRLVRVPDPEHPGVTIPLIETKYSDSLLTQFMKARHASYGDKLQVDITHKGHIAVPVISADDLYHALEKGLSLDFASEVPAIDGEYAVLTGTADATPTSPPSPPHISVVAAIAATTDNDPDFNTLDDADFSLAGSDVEDIGFGI